VTPEQYDLRSTFVGRGMDLNIARAMDTSLRQSFAGMELPPALAAGLAEGMLDAGRRFQSFQSDAQRALYWQSEKVGIERAMKMPYVEVMKLAKLAADRIPLEAQRELARSAAVESRAVIVQLALHGQRLQARKSM